MEGKDERPNNQAFEVRWGKMLPKCGDWWKRKVGALPAQKIQLAARTARTEHDRFMRLVPKAEQPGAKDAEKVSPGPKGGRDVNVGELKKMLKKYPDDMEILNGRCSDYALISENEFSVVKGVRKDGWVMRSHPTMSEENKKDEKEYLYLEGN